MAIDSEGGCMKIKLIAEGSTKWERFIKHWGISFVIDENVLFDTFGDAKVFWRNLKRLRIASEKIRHIIISHDHWDHLAGLWLFLEKHKDVTVYICPEFSRETKERIVSLGARVVEAAGPLEIKKDIYTTGPIKGVYAGQDIYEQAIVIKTAQGLAIITGCAHPGITAIVDHAKKHFGDPLFMAAGGFHLKDAAQETVEKTASVLKSAGIKKVVPLHCTGALAQGVFKRVWRKDYISLSSGKDFEVGSEEKNNGTVFQRGPGADCDCPVCVFSKSHAPGDPYNLSGCPKCGDWKSDEKEKSEDPKKRNHG